MGIKNGDLPDADEVMNAMGQMMWNQNQIIFDNGASNLTRKPYTTSPSTTADSTIITTSGTTLFFTGSSDLYDNFDDDVIDNTKWVSGIGGAGGTRVLKEDGGRLHFQTSDGNAAILYGIASGTASAMDYKALGRDSSIILHAIGSFIHTSSLAAGHFEIQFAETPTGPGSKVWWLGKSNANLISGGYVRIDINYSGGTATAYSTVGSTYTATISGMDTWYLRGYAYSANNTGAMAGSHSLGFVAHNLNDGTWTETYQSNTLQAADSNITNAFLTVNDYTTSSGSLSYYLSSDGTNFESVTPGSVHRFSDIGTNLKMKAISTGATNEENTLYAKIDEYAVDYNLY